MNDHGMIEDYLRHTRGLNAQAQAQDEARKAHARPGAMFWLGAEGKPAEPDRPDSLLIAMSRQPAIYTVRGINVDHMTLEEARGALKLVFKVTGCGGDPLPHMTHYRGKPLP